MSCTEEQHRPCPDDHLRMQLLRMGTFLRRMENYLMDIYEEPEQVLALNDQLLERHLKNLENTCKVP